jgi:hypothetical protein
MFAGNLDLYLSLSNGDFLPSDENTSIDFDITRENYRLFSAFDELYNNIIKGKPFGEDSDYDKDFSDKYEYSLLVDKNKNITWISDDGPVECEDRFVFSKKDDDTYRLSFYRNNIPNDYIYKSSTSIVVRIRNSGSRYGYFNCPFMLMFQKLQNIDTKYHQIHFEEVLYEKKLAKKKNSTLKL